MTLDYNDEMIGEKKKEKKKVFLIKELQEIF